MAAAETVVNNQADLGSGHNQSSKRSFKIIIRSFERLSWSSTTLSYNFTTILSCSSLVLLVDDQRGVGRREELLDGRLGDAFGDQQADVTGGEGRLGGGDGRRSLGRGHVPSRGDVGEEEAGLRLGNALRRGEDVVEEEGGVGQLEGEVVEGTEEKGIAGVVVVVVVVVVLRLSSASGGELEERFFLLFIGRGLA
ncbi:hypothetical protein TYRP_002966 [Tyrophagus putrescentiae]|nr:hypothetical protein TYRP_002966 [Tyrophagus putrescentiae]